MNRILGKALTLLLLLVPTLAWTAADILVSADRNPVHLDESFQLTFEANGSVDDSPDFSPLKVLFDVVRQNESSNISIINGSMSRTKKWVLTVMPKGLGDVQIPAIHFGADKSRPLLIKVRKGSPQAQNNNASFFVKLETNKTSSVQQAQIIVTIRVFSDKSLNEINLSPLQFNHGDVILEPLGEETSFQTKIQGKPYLVIEKKMALFPQKAGPLVIKPLIASGAARTGQRSFFGDLSSKPVRARSNEVQINVEAKPNSNSIWLPAKSLTLRDQWLSDPSQFTVGEPITRVLTLTASGLTAAQLPELKIKNIDSVKMYPDENVLKNSIDEFGITGIRQEKIAYIPSKPGTITLPEMNIKWWNTETNQWQNTKISEQIITVKPSDIENERPPVVTQQIEQPIQMDTKLENASSLNEQVIQNEKWFSSIWFWLTLFFALAWLYTLYLLKRKAPNQQAKVLNVKKAVTFDLKKLKVACEKKEAENCKKQLIDWANVQFQGAKITQLGELKEKVNADLYQHIMPLESVLYSGASKEQWNADALYQGIAAWKKQAKGQTKEKNLKELHLS